jgi:hypothetical protein
LVAFSDGKYLQQWWKHREQRKCPVSWLTTTTTLLHHPH